MQYPTAYFVTIPSTDMYEVNGIPLFKFRVEEEMGEMDRIMRDNYVKLSKNRLYNLHPLAKKCKIPQYKKLKKAQLVEMIETCVRFEPKTNPTITSDADGKNGLGLNIQKMNTEPAWYAPTKKAKTKRFRCPNKTMQHPKKSKNCVTKKNK